MSSRPPGLRRRLLVSIVLTAILAAAATVLATHLFLEIEAEELLDAQLARAARVFDSVLADHVGQDTRIIAIPEPGSTDEGHPYELHVALQVVGADGRLRMRSANAPEQPLAERVPGFSETADGWRVFALPSAHRDDWLLVGEDDRARRELQLEFSAVGLVVTLGGFGIVLLVLLVQVERSLAPVRRLAGELDRRPRDDLSPVSSGGLPQELQPLVGSLNLYLDRLRRAFRTEQEFSSRAAHELRTPLAGLRIHAENALSAQTETDRNESLRHLRDGIERATRIIHRLLLLTRLERASLTERFRRIPVAELLERARTAHATLAERAGLQLTIDCPDPLQINGEPDILLIALDTLLTNATEHAGGSGTIRLAAHPIAEGIAIEVLDEGPGVAPQVLERLQHAADHGARRPTPGLGLEIASWIAGAHGGRLRLANRSERRGFSATLILPNAD